MLNVDDLRATSTKHALIFFIVLLVTGAFFALVFALVAPLLEIPLAGYIAGTIFFAFGLIATGVLIEQYRVITRQISSVVSMAIDLFYAENKREMTTELPTADCLPTSTEPMRAIPLTVNGRAGEPLVMPVNGFDPRDLDYFAKLLANGNRYSEAALEKMPLPYGGGLFGGLKEGTPLTRLMDLCEERGVMTARDAKTRKPGKLLLTDENEIARLLKTKGAE